jgi:hypothetical protein
MGLDMFSYRAKQTPLKETDEIFGPENEQEVDESSKGQFDHEEFFYWRKHPNLHGWMEELYREKGGESDTFNCTPVVLTTEDLDNLEAAIKGGELPNTNGFFFGESEGDEEEINEDLRFVTEARNSISEGYTVWYDSWW